MKGLDIQKNKIAVIGFGVSGKSVTRYFLKNNVAVDVFEDTKEIDFDHQALRGFAEYNIFSIRFSDSLQSVDISQYDYVIASPGVHLDHRVILLAQEAGIEFLTDINAFLRIFREQYPVGKVISVTGSNGKSTTVTLMQKALEAAGTDVYLGGNIGTSPLDFFDEIRTQNPVVVLETSSYQLEYMKPSDYFDIACILNLSDNHLDRYHGKKKLYALAKLGGIDNERTRVLLNLDDADSQKYIVPQLEAKDILAIQFEHLENESVMTLENDSILYSGSGDNTIYVHDIKKLNLKGLHNVYNCAFVCGVLHSLNIAPSDMIEVAICAFVGLPHRVQLVDSINGVVYINDSKSTSPDATVKALESLGISKNIILISGGNDKDVTYDSMSETWSDYVKSLILLPGTANPKLKKLADTTNVELLGEIQTMQEAVDIASVAAQTGDTVLLSPSAASFASFKSFEDRGNQFIECVQTLRN